MAINSISIRLQRVRTEHAFVSVEITDAILEPDSLDPEKMRISAEKLIQAALELGAAESTKWSPEGEPSVGPHPIQTASEK